MKEWEKDVIADTLMNCTPLDNYDNLDVWWKDFKKRYSHNRRLLEKKEEQQLQQQEKQQSQDAIQLKEIADLEKELNDNEQH